MLLHTYYTQIKFLRRHAFSSYLTSCVILYYCIYVFCLFHLQCIICTVLLALALIAGGIASATNAADFQNDYIDLVSDVCDLENLPPKIEEDCNDLYQIRNSQAAASVSYILPSFSY